MLHSEFRENVSEVATHPGQLHLFANSELHSVWNLVAWICSHEYSLEFALASVSGLTKLCGHQGLVQFVFDLLLCDSEADLHSWQNSAAVDGKDSSYGEYLAYLPATS